jgi:hypothetical protein
MDELKHIEEAINALHDITAMAVQSARLPFKTSGDSVEPR